jgi:hypothetical protein
MYRMVGNSPMNSTDPAGLFDVDRDPNQKRAVATADNPRDTIANLAGANGLNVKEYTKWLRLPGGSVKVVGGGTKTLATLNVYTDVIALGEQVEIPNTVVMMAAPEGAKVGKQFMNWGNDYRHLKYLGFNVVRYESYRTTPEDFLSAMKDLGNEGAIHGFMFIGHGHPGGISSGKCGGPKNTTWSVFYSDLENAFGYQLPFVLLNCCMSDYSRNDTTIAGWRENNEAIPQGTVLINKAGFKRAYQEPNIDPDNPGQPKIAAGGRDLAVPEGTPGRQFRGNPGIFNPFGFDYRHSWNLIKEGDHCTKGRWWWW